MLRCTATAVALWEPESFAACAVEGYGTLSSTTNRQCLRAGMDMALAFIASLHGEPTAEEAARFAEYSGNWRDGADDPWGRKIAPGQ